MNNITQALLIVLCVYCIVSIFGLFELYLSRKIYTDDFKKSMKESPIITVLFYFIIYPFTITHRIVNKI